MKITDALVAPHKWIRTRITQEFIDHRSRRRYCFILAERDDGGVFYQTTSQYDSDKQRDACIESARLDLDSFLDAPLFDPSVGKFDVEPNFHIPGRSPGRI